MNVRPGKNLCFECVNHFGRADGRRPMLNLCRGAWFAGWTPSAPHGGKQYLLSQNCTRLLANIKWPSRQAVGMFRGCHLWPERALFAGTFERSDHLSPIFDT